MKRRVHYGLLITGCVKDKRDLECLLKKEKKLRLNFNNILIDDVISWGKNSEISIDNIFWNLLLGEV